MRKLKIRCQMYRRCIGDGYLDKFYGYIEGKKVCSRCWNKLKYEQKKEREFWKSNNEERPRCIFCQRILSKENKSYMCQECLRIFVNNHNNYYMLKKRYPNILKDIILREAKEFRKNIDTHQ